MDRDKATWETDGRLTIDYLERIAELEKQLASGVHTCSNRCQRPMCVLRRENRELEAQVERQRELLRQWMQLAHLTGERRLQLENETRALLEGKQDG